MGLKPGGETYILSESYQGKKHNNPNDLWIDPAGGVYFTDPSYFLEEQDLEQDAEAVYYIPPERDAITRVSGHLPRPNGIIGTADGKILYVASDTIHKTWKFNVHPDGSLSEKELFVENGHDGLTLDELGNLYISNRDSLSVDIYNPEGEFLEKIVFPEKPANACFGRPGDNTLYVTAQTSVYAVRMNVGGQR
jgi:gluconolactonase